MEVFPVDVRRTGRRRGAEEELRDGIRPSSPDCLLLVLDLLPNQRGQYGDERYERRDMQLKVREKFGRLMDDGGSLWHVVDGTKSIEEVGARINAVVIDKVKAVGKGGEPIRMLWEGS